MAGTDRISLAAQALDDLRHGHVTTAVMATVTRSASALGRTGTFSTASGARHWSCHDVDDLVSDFFSVPGRAAALAERAGGGEDSAPRFRRQIERTLKNLIIDRYRATPRGVLDRRVARRMRGRVDVVDVAPAHWAFERDRDRPHWGGDDQTLVDAVQHVPVDPPPPWSDESERQPPATPGASIDAACNAVLDAAACPVDRRTVCRIVVDHVIPFDLALVRESDGDDIAAAQTTDPVPEATLAAEQFWAALSDDERVLLGDVQTPARQLESEGMLGLKKSAIAERQAKLQRQLLDFGLSIPNGESAVRHLFDLQAIWVAGQNLGDAP